MDFNPGWFGAFGGFVTGLVAIIALARGVTTRNDLEEKSKQQERRLEDKIQELRLERERSAADLREQITAVNLVAKNAIIAHQELQQQFFGYQVKIAGELLKQADVDRMEKRLEGYIGNVKEDLAGKIGEVGDRVDMFLSKLLERGNT